MTSRRLNLDRMHIIAMLQDAAFFTAVPAFRYLCDSVTAAEGAASVAIARGACKSCGDTWRYFRPVADAFVLRLDELIAEQSAALGDIRAYLAGKKKYDIQQVVVYYRASPHEPIKKLTF
jgi:hypothetical protein